MDDTIVAIATPLGEGGLGVIRLSGPQAIMIAARMFHSKEKLTGAPTHTLHHGWVSDIDEAVAALFRAPRSYTGEDVVEISCHGSPAVLKEIVRLCIAEGARIAKPGEFTERAYLNGKIDLLQAEAVADLIHSQSSRARSAAAGQLQGQLSMRINGLREQLINLLAHIEANLDFAEEEIPMIAREKIMKSLAKIKTGLDDLISTSVRGRLLRTGLRIALAGKPNVGKSSIFNSFLAQNRAIVTDMPGTTRDTLEEKIEWDGFPIVLIDTAGLRETADIVEAEGTERAARAQSDADVVLLVLDGSAPLSGDDERIAKRFIDKPLVVALNKADRPIAATWQGSPAALPVSAKTGQGLSAIKQALLATVQTAAPENESSSVVVTNLRHVNHLEEALKQVANAEEAIARGELEESVALDVRGALEQLGQITGESVTEDVLSAIFRTFCIGK